MNAIRDCDVLIVGAGPAGLATALYLLRRKPDLAGRVIAIEKARHPRIKVCAGGLIPKTMLALDELDIPLDVPAVEVTSGVAQTPAGDVELGNEHVLCTIIRRDQFDARLASAAKLAGLEIIESCRAGGLEQDRERVIVVTDRGAINARLVVAADGSGSRIRASLFGQGKETIGRALMCDIPADAAHTPEFAEHRYRFDFNCVSAGVRGYAWSFPCLIDGRAHLNVGIYDQNPHRAANGNGAQSSMLGQLRSAFPELPLADLGRASASYKAFPIRWYEPADRFVSGRVLLAGDAAGVDPLMGEGISCAFEHGKLAAESIACFLDGDRNALERFDDALHRAAVGRKLAKLNFAARHFYGPRHRLYFRLARLSQRAQAIGVDWYNGANHLDELPTRRLLARWAKSVLFGASVR